MPLVFQLPDGSGEVVRALADPSGGTFDAAGDFDRLLQAPFADHLRVLSRVDPDGDTVFTPDEMSDLLSDVEHLEAKARDGPEKRGIRRLRVLATRCSVLPNSRMMALGD